MYRLVKIHALRAGDTILKPATGGVDCTYQKEVVAYTHAQTTPQKLVTVALDKSPFREDAYVLNEYHVDPDGLVLVRNQTEKEV